MHRLQFFAPKESSNFISPTTFYVPLTLFLSPSHHSELKYDSFLPLGTSQRAAQPLTFQMLWSDLHHAHQQQLPYSYTKGTVCPHLAPRLGNSPHPGSLPSVRENSNCWLHAPPYSDLASSPPGALAQVPVLFLLTIPTTCRSSTAIQMQMMLCGVQVHSTLP